MDRLVCGDVGYGKTEVAMRAAFRAVTDGKQVAVLVPTTVLAFQHEQSFRARFEGLSDHDRVALALQEREGAEGRRSTASPAARSTSSSARTGCFRATSTFQDLGLIIVDEEHRFGVEHKEKLKTLKVNTHVLTLTATPIPRTLHMSLSGLRDISLINTPPVDRLPIRTYVSKYDDSLIQRAIEFELSRGGQVFFLHNRVQSIYETANRIQELVPAARVGVGHGQMARRRARGGDGALLSRRKPTSSSARPSSNRGLDIPVGQHDPHQPRRHARASRSSIRSAGASAAASSAPTRISSSPRKRAVTEDAKKRLEVIQRFVELGSGFSVASHDLEIRGGGDLLGPQQSGQHRRRGLRSLHRAA